MFEAVVIGVSAGGFQALKTILGSLPAAIPVPIAIVQHRDAQSDTYLTEHLNRISTLEVKEAEDKEPLLPGVAYIAPGGYHLLIEPDKSFSLCMDEKVHYSRPAIDPLFESAAQAFGSSVIGIILTGANADGAQGLKTVKAHGGVAIVQNPKTAEVSYMPTAALQATPVDYIVNLEHIAPLVVKLCKEEAHGTGTKG